MVQHEQLKSFLSSEFSGIPSFGVARKDEIPADLSWILGTSVKSTSIDYGDISNMQENVSLTEQAADMISLVDASILLKNATYTSNVAAFMKSKSSNSPLFEYRFLPFMSVYSRSFQEHDKQQDGALESAGESAGMNRLDSMLCGWGMTRCKIDVRLMAMETVCFFSHSNISFEQQRCLKKPRSVVGSCKKFNCWRQNRSVVGRNFDCWRQNGSVVSKNFDWWRVGVRTSSGKFSSMVIWYCRGVGDR